MKPILFGAPRYGVMAVLGALAAGCDGDGSGAPAAEVRAFAEELAERSCWALRDSCESIGTEYDRVGCEHVVLAGMNIRYSDRTALVDEKRSDCMASVESALSGRTRAWPPPLPECRAALVGTVARGEPCAFDGECAPATGEVTACIRGSCGVAAAPSATAGSTGDWGQPCYASGDCEPSSRCLSGLCVPSALVDSCAGRALASPDSSVLGACAPVDCSGQGLECVADPETRTFGCALAGGPQMPCHANGSCDAENLVCSEGRCTEVGGVGEPCGADAVCASGRVCAYDEALCSADDGYVCCCVAGAEGQHCLPGGECNDGMFCVAGKCVSRGGEGAPCEPDRSCQAWLTCVGDTCVPYGNSAQLCGTDPQRICHEGFECVWGGELCDWSDGNYVYSCCLAAPGPWEPCDSGACAAGLGCERDSSTCVPAGYLSGPCSADGACNDGLSCMEDYDYPDMPVFVNLDTHRRCVTAGAWGEPCFSDGTCDEGLECYTPTPEFDGCDDAMWQWWGPCCLPEGGAGEFCYDDHTCDAGLDCIEGYPGLWACSSPT